MRRERGEPWPWVVGAALLLSTGVAAGAGDDVEPIRVEFHAPSGCPGAASFFDQVRARTAKVRAAAPGEQARTFTITVVEDARKVRGRLTIEDPPAPPASREVSGEQCSEIVSALALITALAVDPRASTAPPASLPAPPPAPPPPRASSSAPPPEATGPHPGAPYAPSLSPMALPLPALPALPLPPPTWRFTLGVDLGGVSAVSPSLAPTIAWFIDAELQRPSIFSPTIRASILRADSGFLGRPPVRARFQWLAGRVEGCPIRFSPRATVGMWPCALLDAGAIEASGQGRVMGEDKIRPWIAPGLLGRVQWDIFGPALIEAEGGATFPLVRDTFFLRPGIDVQTAPPVGGFFAFGVGVHFF